MDATQLEEKWNLVVIKLIYENNLPDNFCLLNVERLEDNVRGSLIAEIGGQALH